MTSAEVAVLRAGYHVGPGVAVEPKGFGRQAGAWLQVLRRAHDRAPHVRRGTGVPAETFLRLLEIAADDVGEFLQLDPDGGVEGVEVVHADQSRGHVPLVLARHLIVTLDV